MWGLEKEISAVSLNVEKEKMDFFKRKWEWKKPCPRLKCEDIEEGEHPERGKWASKAEFLLSCIGFAVGLGNVWRFPYKCYKNGGGAFLIPYGTCLALCGLPLVVMELSLGQFSSQGPTTVWSISPIFSGIGWAMVTVVTLVGIYYNVVISYILFYFFASFTTTLPWGHCDNWWNTHHCYVAGSNGTESTAANSSLIVNSTTFSSNNISRMKSPTEEFWENYVLQTSGGIEEAGSIRWELALLLLFTWIVIFLCLIKGIKSSGKVVYFTATFPYLILVILLIRGATLPGAGTGILYYITPQPDRLLDTTVWFDAALQIFYSLCPGSGALIMLGSYNKFNNNCFKDAVTVGLMNCATSILCGFVVFSVIGFMSHELGVDVSNVVTDGPGLAFVTFSEAISKMPVAPLWAALFFIMLFTVGLDSQFVAIEVVVSSLTDAFPKYLRPWRSTLTAVICAVLFLLGLPMVTNGGIYLLHLVDSYSAGIPLLILAFLECIIINYIYGQEKFAADLHLMVGIKLNLYWRLCWKFITPTLILAILIFCLVMHSPLTYGDYTYPDWANNLGWSMAAFSLTMIPALGAWKVLSHPQVFQVVKSFVHPSEDWGPSDHVTKQQWHLVKSCDQHPNTDIDKTVENGNLVKVFGITSEGSAGNNGSSSDKQQAPIAEREDSYL